MIGSIYKLLGEENCQTTYKITVQKVSVNLVVRNGQKYLGYFLDHLKHQTYPHNLIEFNIWDNNSDDRTVEILRFREPEFADFASFNLIESKTNIGMWPGQEKLLPHSTGKYIVGAAVDVLMDKNFIAKATEQMEKDANIGALQAKVYTYNIDDLSAFAKASESTQLTIIDTCGFEIYRSRKVLNIGHGLNDSGQFNETKEIFAVEGAIPVFRRSAIDDCIIDGHFADPDFFWYGDDLDISWRMRIFGWKQLFAPDVIAWHDRQTTKTAAKHWWKSITRLGQRRKIPIQKRRLDWRNLHFTIIKNDYIINILKDLPFILAREIMVLGYTLLFEPSVLKEIPVLVRHLPRMLRRRRIIMKRKRTSAAEIHRWFR